MHPRGFSGNCVVAYAAIALVDSRCYSQVAVSSRHTLLTVYKIATARKDM